MTVGVDQVHGVAIEGGQASSYSWKWRASLRACPRISGAKAYFERGT